MPDLTHWASATPDVLALVTEDETRTFAELDANANRLARALRNRGLVAGDAVALIASNRPAFVETVYACTARRVPPHAGQLAPHRRRGRLHRRRLRGQGADRHRRRRGPGARRASAPRRRARSRLLSPAARRRVRNARGCAGGRVRRSARRPDAGHADDVHVGHHRPAQGRAPPCRSRGGRYIVHVDQPLRLQRSGRRRAPLHRSAVPRGAARLLARRRRSRLRRDRRADGQVGRRGDAAAHRRNTASPTRTWCRRCSIGCCRCPTTCGRKYDISSLRHVLHGAAPCPVPVKQRMIEWVGPIIWSTTPPPKASAASSTPTRGSSTRAPSDDRSVPAR